MIIAGLAAALLGVLGLVGVGLAWGAGVLAQGWLTAAVTVQGIPLGCLLFLLVDHLVPEPWSFRLNPVLEAAALTMPLAGLAFIPVMADPAAIYPWAAAPSPWPAHWPRQTWLQAGPFAVRTLVYFVLWSGLAVLGANRSRGLRRPALAGPGLALLALAATFAAIDWVMSLEPPFHSTIFGLVVLNGQVLSGLTFLCLAGLPAAAPERDAPPRVAGLGATLLSLVLLWAYLNFMQYLVIWSGNLPHEVAWVLHRTAGGWPAATWAIWILLWAVPFLLLMQGRFRRSRGGVLAAAALVLPMRAVETAWWILPSWEGDTAGRVLAALAALATLGGLWLAAFRLLAGRRRAIAMEAGHA